MKNNKRTWKQFATQLVTLAIVLSLVAGITKPRQAQAVDYGLKNPTIDSNGVATWNCVCFGNYWQNDTNGDGVANKNDKKQPIKWRVLSVDGADAFLLADQNLDAGSYNESLADVTWGSCTRRSWLNGYNASSNVACIDYSNDNFIDAAFTQAEKNAIRNTTIVNEDSSNGGNNNTKDKIYLLSIAEVSNVSYGFDSIFDRCTDNRQSTNTAYVAGKDGMLGDGEIDSWRLRSLVDGATDAAFIARDGSGSYYSDLREKGYAIRPALHLNLSSKVWTAAGNVSASDIWNDDVPNARPTTSPCRTQATRCVPAVVGSIVKDKTASYKVVSANKKQPVVAYIKAAKKNVSNITVPARIKVKGVTYQVKSIASKAFANNKKLKTVTIGKNITTIGKSAFAGCKKLKKITIKSTKLKSGAIGKNAFKGTAKNLVVKVPRKQYRAYKKFLKKKGNKKVKIKK